MLALRRAGRPDAIVSLNAGARQGVSVARLASGPVSSTHYFEADPDAPLVVRPLRAVLGGRERDLVTASGVFSAERVDAGTAVLLRVADDSPRLEPLEGVHLMDLGCGWGAVALSMALAQPSRRVWAVDVNPRALALTTMNAQRLGLEEVRAVTPDQVPHDVVLGELWSNPPIRVGKAALHAMLALWLGRLHPDGEAHLVVQRNLGADSLARWLAGPEVGVPLTVERLATSAGFRVLRVMGG